MSGNPYRRNWTMQTPGGSIILTASRDGILTIECDPPKAVLGGENARALATALKEAATFAFDDQPQNDDSED